MTTLNPTSPADLATLQRQLLDRFGRTHARAVATIVTGSHAPVRLNDLTRQYRELGPVLRSSAPTDGWVSQFQRELGSLVQIRRADRPSTQPDARYLRALSALENGEVDIALAETMRLPGAACIPNGELAHRFSAAVDDCASIVVVTASK